jgi:phage anti-repressor protein
LFFVHMLKILNTMKNQKNNQIQELHLITQGDQILIDARTLHQTLGVKSIFANWIKSRIEDFGFEQGRDFFLNLEKTLLGRPKREFHLTLDMAKELAMLERNEIGREIRRYFIAKEKQARGISQLPPKDEVFKGLQVKHVNNRMMLPYREVLARCGYSTKSSSADRKNRYWMHFIRNFILSFMALKMVKTEN